MNVAKKLAGLIIILLIFAPGAFCYTIEDNYWGAANHNYGDVISGSNQRDKNLFNIRGMDVAFAGGFMNVKVFTGFFEDAPGGYGTVFGDLFISTNGWKPKGTVSNNYKYDNASNGESWEFVLDTSQNKMYGGDFSIMLSQDAPPQNGGSRFIVRDGQEVYRDSGGTGYEGSSVNLNNVANALFSNADAPSPFPYLEYFVSLDTLGITGGETIGLKWGMSCANDTIEGAVVAPVPEPGTFLLLGAGLIGLAFYRRKQNVVD